MSLVGVVRAEALRTRNFDYIRAAQAQRRLIVTLSAPYVCLMR